MHKYSKLYLIIMAAVMLIDISAYAARPKAQRPAKRQKMSQKAGAMPAEEPGMTKKTILFVCGGNTGRSFMGEWHARKSYGTQINTFSRGSGILPGDSVFAEPPAAALVIQHKEATPQEVALHRATPISITDILNSDLVLTMTSSHRNRLIDIINRECGNAYIDSKFAPSPTNSAPFGDSDKAKWVTMCQNAQALKDKIHTLIGCATGTDGDVPDGYGKPDSAYPPIRDQIVSNTDLVQKAGWQCKK